MTALLYWRAIVPELQEAVLPVAGYLVGILQLPACYPGLRVNLKIERAPDQPLQQQ